MWGMARNHLTSHCHRDNRGSSWASRVTGDGAASMAAVPTAVATGSAPAGVGAVVAARPAPPITMRTAPSTASTAPIPMTRADRPNTASDRAPTVGVDDHARRAIGVHDGDRPPARGRLPDQLLGPHALGGDDPEALVTGTIHGRAATPGPVDHVVVPDPPDLVVGHPGQVGVEVRLGSDPDEHRPVAVDRRHPEPDVGVGLPQEPAGRTGVHLEVDLLGSEGHRFGRQLIDRGRQVAVVVPVGAIGDGGRRSQGHRHQADQGHQGPDDQQQHPQWTHHSVLLVVAPGSTPPVLHSQCPSRTGGGGGPEVIG